MIRVANSRRHVAFRDVDQEENMADNQSTNGNDGILFLGDAPPRKPGKVTEQFGFGEALGFFSKKPQDLTAEIQSVMSKMVTFLDAASGPQSRGFKLDEIECSLALSAEGNFYFIAKAGVEGGIKLTWKREV
jgi:hypothetical protein